MKIFAVFIISLISSCLSACNSGGGNVAASNQTNATSSSTDDSFLVANGSISNIPAINAMVPLIYIQLSATSAELCSGTVIGKSEILTAAHCVLDMAAKPDAKRYTQKNLTAANKFLVIWPKNLAQAVNIYSTGQGVNNWAIYRVKQIYAHPNAFLGAMVSAQGLTISDPTNLNDLAVLQLSTPLASQYHAAQLATQNPAKNQQEIIAGYGVDIGSGVLLPTANGNPGVLRLANSLVNGTMANGALINVGGSVAKGLGYSKTCAGDSGGPDLVFTNQTYIISGVHSYGDGSGCGSANKPSTSMSVAYYKEWIAGGYTRYYLGQ